MTSELELPDHTHLRARSQFDDMPPLHLALRCVNSDIFWQLIAFGADPEVKWVG